MTWDSGFNIAAPFSLSNNDETLTMATGQTANTTHLRANAVMASGLWYWEVVLNNVVNGSTGTTGIGMERAGAAGFLGSDGTGHGIGYWPQGSLFRNNNALSAVATLVDGDILMFAFNATAGRFWAGKNGTWGQGNPGTDVSPHYSTDLAGFSWRPSTTPYTSSGGEIVEMTLVQPGANNFTIPSGFSYLRDTV